MVLCTLDEATFLEMEIAVHSSGKTSKLYYTNSLKHTLATVMKKRLCCAILTSNIS